MKTIIYVLFLSLISLSGFLFANREVTHKTPNHASPKPLSAAEKKEALKKWEATPDGIMYKKWQASAAGKKVQTAATKISKSIRDNSNMEAIITSLSLPTGSRLGFGVMVKIQGEDYILAFGSENNPQGFFNLHNEFGQLQKLQVNDKIIIRSHQLSQAPKYSYPIIMGNYVEQDNQIIFKRAEREDGC